ncbi:MAG TPA: YdcF family protein [Edaphobacter sp.]
MKLLRRTVLALLLLGFFVAAVVYINFFLIPHYSGSTTHFDTIVVLGTPSRLDGSPSPEQRERVLEGVREYKAGVAPRIIMTGGPAHNHFVEAHTMALFAATQGVPASAIFEEQQAQNTIQNIYYSAEIMHQHDWRSAEVVSSPYHLGRTALILSTFDRRQPSLAIDWSTHPSGWPSEYGVQYKIVLYSVEAWRCLQLRIFGFPSSRFLPLAR